MAIVAITSGATLGAAAIAAHAARTQWRLQDASQLERMQARFRHERELHDVDELRAVLDEAADAIRAVRSTAAEPSSPGWLEQGLARMEPIHAKLALRLGSSHRLSESARSLVEVLQDIDGLYASAALRTESDEDDFWASFEAMREEVGIRADRFLEDAQRTVGSQLLITDEATERRIESA